MRGANKILDWDFTPENDVLFLDLAVEVNVDFEYLSDIAVTLLASILAHHTVDKLLGPSARVAVAMVAATLVNGTVIGITVATAGPLVAFGFLILPVLTARTFACSLRGNLWGFMWVGSLVALAGFWLSYHDDLPLGDTVIATGCVVLGLAKIMSMVLGARSV